ncbi:IS3 family transposase [Streptomyces sp. NPDC006544]|uniref:IS3 family transposase n=1 Tax=Streptomyces sp. NPDC006544 TaxID=3154583 RepID=UPI0033AA90EB
MNRCRFVEHHQRRHGAKRLCDILGLPRSSFYYWRRTTVARAARQAVEAGIAARIRKVHQDSDGTYGAPRIPAELRDEGGPAVNHKRVARIIRTIGLEGARLRRRHRTTVADQAAPKAPATVIDLVSRRLAGWAIADNMRTELVTDALTAAERTRRGASICMTSAFHSALQGKEWGGHPGEAGGDLITADARQEAATLDVDARVGEGSRYAFGEVLQGVLGFGSGVRVRASSCVAP